MLGSQRTNGECATELSYKEYEILIAKIVEGLAKLQGLSHSIITHNAQVIGVSGASHQIDVLWEFEIGPIKYKVIFQAKHWKDKVTLVAVNTFNGVLRDIADAKGVMITCTGYDKGNIDKVARGFGIELLVLDEHGNLRAGIKGPAMSAKVTLGDIRIGIDNFRFATKEQADAFREYADRVPRETIDFYTRSGKRSRIGDLTDLIYELARKNDLDRDGQGVTFQPEELIFVRTSPNMEVEIQAIHARISKKEEVLGETSMLITHILQSATGDQTYYVDDAFNVHKQEHIKLNLEYRDPIDPTKTRTTVFSTENRIIAKQQSSGKSD